MEATKYLRFSNKWLWIGITDASVKRKYVISPEASSQSQNICLDKKNILCMVNFLYVFSSHKAHFSGRYSLQQLMTQVAYFSSYFSKLLSWIFIFNNLEVDELFIVFERSSRYWFVMSVLLKKKKRIKNEASFAVIYHPEG